jgi:hypothetical protein
MNIYYPASPNETPISFEEFIDVIDNIPDLSAKEGLEQASKYLKALAANRTFLCNLICQELKNSNEFQEDNPATAFTLLLSSRKKYIIRANIWQPLEYAALKEEEMKVFAYDCYHDHDFDLITVGYFGPGYTTEVFEYDRSEVLGYIGEKVRLNPLGEFKLGIGDVLIYQKKKHIHIQKPPENTSVSINIIPLITGEQLQYIFDIHKQQIQEYGYNVSMYRCNLLNFAAMLDDDNITDILLHIGQTDRCEKSRFFAYKALLEKNPNMLDIVIKSVQKNDSLIVRNSLSILIDRTEKKLVR